jgi:hypothetical protein
MTIVVAVATAVLAWLTSRYVRLTGELVEESRRSREPSVAVDFEMPDRSLRLIVCNYGRSPAKDVRITVLKDVTWLRGSQSRTGLADIGPVKNGISYLTPSRRLRYYLGFPNWKDTLDEGMEVSLQIRFR